MAVDDKIKLIFFFFNSALTACDVKSLLTTEVSTYFPVNMNNYTSKGILDGLGAIQSAIKHTKPKS